MVSRVNVPLDDADHEDAKRIKNKYDLGWAELITEGAKALENQGGPDD